MDEIAKGGAPSNFPHGACSPSRTALLYAAQALTILLIAFIGLRLYRTSLGEPWILSGDSLNTYLVGTVIAEEGWWWHGERHAAPFVLEMVHFPVVGHTDFAGMWLVSRFTSNPFAIVHVYYLLAIVLAGWTFLWSLQRLGIRFGVAWGVGLLYAYLPHVFQRSIFHLGLIHYVFPPLCMAAVRIGTDTFDRLSRTDRAWVFAFALLAGLSYIYQAFFAVLIVGAAWVLMLLRKRPGREWKRTLAPLALLAAVLVGVFLNLLPSRESWSKAPLVRQEVFPEREAAEADGNGFSARHFFMPNQRHPLRFMRNLQMKMETHTPMTFEAVSSFQGTASALGLLLLLASLPIGLLRDAPSYSRSDVCVAALLALFCLLWAMSGGFGIIFNCLASSAIRAHSRIVPILCFFSLFMIATLLSRWLRPQRSVGRTWGAWSLTAALIGGAVLDQSCWHMINRHREETQAKLEDVRPFVHSLERDLPEQSMIYQFPLALYPNYRQPLEMDLLIPGVLSKSLRWSYPPLHDSALSLRREIEALIRDENMSQAMERLRALGFKGIYFDPTIDPKTAEADVARLHAVLGPPALVSAHKGRLYFSLSEATVSEVASAQRADFIPRAMP